MKRFFILNGGIIHGMLLNVNGRICLMFAVIWGILGIILIKFINPGLDKILNWIKNKTDIRVLKACVLLVIGFLIFDGAITSVALKSFYAKLVNDFDLDIKTGEYSSFTVENELFSEENMLLIYPNIQIAGTKYNNVYVRKSL